MSLAVKRFNIVKMVLNKSMFDENVINIILKYYWKDLKNKRKVLLDWINIEWLSWDALSANPNAINLLENNIDKINWTLPFANHLEYELAVDALNKELDVSSDDANIQEGLKKRIQQLLSGSYSENSL